MKSTFEKELFENRILIYKNVGDSMMPLIKQDQDVIIIERPKAWDDIKTDNSSTKLLKKWDVVLYKRDSGQYVLHRVIKVRKNDYLICGDNRFYKESGITDKHVLGILTSVKKPDMEILIGSKEYRKYLFKFCYFYSIRHIIMKIKYKKNKLKQ